MTINILKYLKHRSFYRSLQKVQNKRPFCPDFLNWEDVKSIALINQGGSDFNRWQEQQKVFENLKKMGKHVFMFTYYDEKKVPEHLKELHQKIIMKNEVNWCGIPCKSLQNEVVGQSFDLIIDLTGVSKITTCYLLSIAHARMRIGENIPEFRTCFDLMIDRKKGETVQQFIEHTLYYLKTINKSTICKR